MHITRLFILIFALTAFISVSFKENKQLVYQSVYTEKLEGFKLQQSRLLACIEKSDLTSKNDLASIRNQIELTRNELKGLDFWFRYLEPIQYKKINGPLPVEWETEVFEKYEKPYKREGAGLTLALLYLEEENIEKKSLLNLIQTSINASQTYSADSITKELQMHHHFFLCNRLFILNLAAIYTTGFECPDTGRIVPELDIMLGAVETIYQSFNESFPETKLPQEYLDLYQNTIRFVKTQPNTYSTFDHFTFIKNYINPLFTLNQKLINQYGVITKSFIDYSLSKSSTSIFEKDLYFGQNTKGVFLRVKDEKVLDEIDKVGKLLFYDPILSGNNKRACVSCHKSDEYFTDTSRTTSLQFDQKSSLTRNTPSLINVNYNHLIMLDGKHFTLQHQTKDVITNPIEMGSSETEILAKVLNCKVYNKVFKKLLKYTPQEKEVTIDHILSAITFYYSKFSKAKAPFDEAMNTAKHLDQAAKEGFNIFMSKAQCATCHFVPQFNGVKPPYVGSEFEVLGVPADTGFGKLSDDKGRYHVNPAFETNKAFRTGSLRNAQYTKPYMHNGVFASLNEVMNFYNNGGGAGRGLEIDNQTLSSDKLGLTKNEIGKVIKFMESLNEEIQFEDAPEKLPVSKNKALNSRKVGGEY